MNKVYIAGISLSQFGKLESSLYELVISAISRLREEHSLDEIDAVFVGSMAPAQFIGDGNLGPLIADWIGKSGLPAFCVDTASSAGAAAFHTATQSVASDLFKDVLVIACEKMSDLPTPRITAILAQVIDKKERIIGASMPSLAALVTKRYMYEYKMPYKALMRVAIKNHSYGYYNSFAHFRKLITEKDILDSRIVAEPLRLYDCSPISDGVACCILTSKKTDINVAGIGCGTDHIALRNRDSLTSFKATILAAKQAFSMASLGPADIDFAEIHDAFTSFEIISLEDLGFFEKGTAWQKTLDGATEKNGVLPVNISGGLKSRGHPVGTSGLAQIVEIAYQMRKQAGKRQLEKVNVALAHSIGGLASCNFVTILCKS
ncbi:MAG: thiolase domain-containing protein [Candidatus Hydrogenedentota bacterium]